MPLQRLFLRQFPVPRSDDGKSRGQNFSAGVRDRHRREYDRHRSRGARTGFRCRFGYRSGADRYIQTLLDPSDTGKKLIISFLPLKRSSWKWAACFTRDFWIPARPPVIAYLGGRLLDINKILEELRQEREQLGQAILSLERLALGGAKRRGRPPLWMAAAKASAPVAKKRGRPPGSKNKSGGVSPSAIQ